MKKNFRILVLAIALLTVPFLLRAEISVGVDAELAGVTKYIWRGMEVNKDFVLQPSVTAKVGSFSFNTWGNMDTTDYGKEAGYGDQSGRFTEIDLTLSYSYSYELLNFTGGIINYSFPNTGLSSTYEAFVALGLGTILSPTLSLYYDIDNIHGLYGNFGVSHSFEISKEVALNLSSSIGYGSSDFNEGYFGNSNGGLVDFNLGANVTFALNKHFKIKPFITFSSIVDSGLRDEKAYESNDNLYGGVAISASF